MAMTDGFMRRGLGLARSALAHTPAYRARAAQPMPLRPQPAEKLADDQAGAVEAAVRQPLGNIEGAAELLLETPLGPLQRSYVKAMLGWTTELRAGLDRALGRPAEPSGEAVDLAALTEAVLRLLAPAARAKHVVLEGQIEPDLPALHCRNPQALRHLLAKLASGALSRTEAGTICLRALRVAGGIRLVVIDGASPTGVIDSFDPEEAARLQNLALLIDADLEMQHCEDGTSASLTLPLQDDLSGLDSGRIGPDALLALLQSEFGGETAQAASDEIVTTLSRR